MIDISGAYKLFILISIPFIVILIGILEAIMFQRVLRYLKKKYNLEKETKNIIISAFIVYMFFQSMFLTLVSEAFFITLWS